MWMITTIIIIHPFPLSIHGVKWWPDHVFAFLVSITEVYVRNTVEYYQKDGRSVSQLDFRRKLDMQLLNNDLYGHYEDYIYSPSNKSTRPRVITHEILKVPNYYGRFNGNTCIPVSTKWLQKTCACGNHVRTYSR